MKTHRYIAIKKYYEQNPNSSNKKRYIAEIDKLILQLENERKKLSNFYISDLEQFANQLYQYFGLSIKLLKARSRQRCIVEKRQIFHYLAQIYSKFSLSEIGKISGHDHTTVLYSRKVVENFLLVDTDYRQKFKKIIKYFY